MGLLLKWSDYALELGRRTHVMGVVNVTPDSFSDGGRFFDKDRAVSHGISMAEQGADIIDVGGESTRPYSQRLSEEEETARVVPVIEALSQAVSIPISIDTYKGAVAREALKAGASMINDISSLRFDPQMASVAAEAEVPLVCMHMKGTPETMQVKPQYDDLIGEVSDFLGRCVQRAVAAGAREDLLILDPGIGFGKSFDDNLAILRELRRFAALGRPLLVGSSNKAFIGHVLGKEVHERRIGTLATVAVAAMNGAHIVRVHDVQGAVETVKMVDAIKSGLKEE